jgi:hypothetical protein
MFGPVRLENGPTDVTGLVDGQTVFVCLAGVEVNNLPADPASKGFGIHLTPLTRTV